MSKLPYFLDIGHPDLWVTKVDEATHRAYVDQFVADLKAQGFEAEVATYNGPAGGYAQVDFGPGAMTLEALDDYMTEVYGPDWPAG